jgi:hypothetical protein
VLAVLGAARVHLHNFPLFLTILVGATIVTVAVLVATGREESGSKS